MCGIASIFAYGSQAPCVDREQLARVCHRMASRGPDGAGVWVNDDDRVALGHRRLAIIDLSERGAQPMRSVDGRYVISFNGEIYNYRELRTGLEAIGRHFRSDSDTEVLLYGYRQWGQDVVRRLRGMFAFVIWDNVRRGMFVARDLFGIKPLYFSDDGSTLRIASEVKALLAGGGIDTAPEPAGHVGFFLWGSVPEPYTLYRGIRALPAGHHMWVSEGGHPVIRQYAGVGDLLRTADSAPPPLDARETADALRAALLDSVRNHLVADVDVGVFLSAGLDSTTMAALASELGGRVRSVTLGFIEYRGTDQDEVPLAELVARTYGLDHQTIWVTRADFDTEREHMLDRMDQPTTDGVNTYFVSRAAAQVGLKATLSGLGGDELLGGYPSFRQIPRLVSIAAAVPASRTIGRGVRAVAAPLLGLFTSQKAAGLLEYGGDFGGAYLLRRGLFMPWELDRVLDADLVRDGWKTLATRATLQANTEQLPDGRVKVSALEAGNYMRNQLLRDTDWASMTWSLEVRVPLVDPVLWRTVSLLSRARPVSKRAMGRTCEPQLPPAVLNRSKTGFLIPTSRWITEDSSPKRAMRGLRGWALRVYAAHVQ